MTHRQFLAWEAWRELEWNRPSRSDFYIMQNTAEARRGWVKEPGKVETKEFRLKFETVKPKAEPMVDEDAGLTDEEKRVKAATRSQSIWFGLTGFRSGKRAEQPLRTGPGPEGKPGVEGSDLEVKVAQAAAKTRGRRETPRPKGSNPPRPGARPVRSLEPGKQPPPSASEEEGDS